jgi:hypothetical protein
MSEAKHSRAFLADEVAIYSNLSDIFFIHSVPSREILLLWYAASF